MRTPHTTINQSHQTIVPIDVHMKIKKNSTENVVHVKNRIKDTEEKKN